VFDGERYVAQALESIIGQSVGCFQIVVVDDASPDDSVGVVESMRNEVEAKGHRLEVLRLRTNQGIAGARNAGLAAADGSLIAFLDQDDTWPPDRTAVLLAAMRRTRAAVAQGHMTFLDVMPGLDRPWVRDDWFGRDHVGAVMGATLCNADVFTEVGQLDADMRTGYDDVDWFSRVRDAGVGITLVPHVTVLRKVHDRNQSRRAARDQSDMFAIIRAHRSRTSGSRGEDD
jgi:glycosyltransferase involved in cell wall biosynthesis